MYLVTTNWRGALHIDPMRLFKTVEAAAKYGETIQHLGDLRIYELSDNKPPKRIKIEFID